MNIATRLRRASPINRLAVEQPHIARLREALLSQMDVFGGLSPEAMHNIAARLPMATVRSGQVIYEPGETGEALFFLKSGAVRVYRIAPDGRKLMIARFGPGSTFGDMALAGQAMTGSFAEAADDCTLCIMSSTDVEELLEQHPGVAVRLVKLLAGRLQDAEQRAERLAYHTIPERLAATLLELKQGSVVSGYSHQDLAELLGITRETVTRALDDFKSQGLVRVDRKRIELCDTGGLSRIAGQP